MLTYPSPLTKLTGKSSFDGTPIHQNVFHATNGLMVENILLCYLDHDLPFHNCTDAFDYQLESVIMQQNDPVSFHSWKPSSTKLSYHWNGISFSSWNSLYPFHQVDCRHSCLYCPVQPFPICYMLME